MKLTIKNILLALWHSILPILMVSVVMMTLFGGFTYLFIEPEYTATAKLYVYNEKTDDRDMTSGDLTVSKSLVNTYLIIIRSGPVLEQVADRLRPVYPEISAKSIDEILTGSAINATEAFFISATSPDRQMAADIINEIVEAAPAEIIRVVKAASVELIEPASVPDIDDYDWPIVRNAIIGFMLGIVLSSAYILVTNALDTVVYGRQEILENFNLPVLGIIPPQTDGGKGAADDNPARFLLNEHSPFEVAEAYRMARTNIIYLPNESACKKIAVTSAIESEGKSTCGINLAKVLAQLDKKVLLIDGDMRHPQVAHYLGMRNDRGLSEYLAGLCPEAEILRDETGSFDVIVSGTGSSAAAELLATARMHTLLEKFSRIYDYIIVDTPPVNLVTDATVLAGAVDGYLLSVRAGCSNIDDLKQAVRTLEQVDARILGVILENVKPGTGKYGKYSRHCNSYL